MRTNCFILWPLLVWFGMAFVNPVMAHQPDKIDHVTMLKVDLAGAISLRYQVYWGEIVGAPVKKQEIDSDGNGQFTPSEKEKFVRAQVEAILLKIGLSLRGQAVALILENAQLELPEDSSPAPFWITLTFRAQDTELARHRRSVLQFQDRLEHPPALVGNHRLMLELVDVKSYRPSPVYHENNALALREISLDLAPQPGNRAFQAWGAEIPSTGEVRVLSPTDSASPSEKPALPKADNASHSPDQATSAHAEEDRLHRYLLDLRQGKASLWLLGVALLISFWLGASHALGPGHGKAMVAGYLIGTQGRMLDAVWLGMIVTLTHVSTVILLGLVLWAFSGYFRQEQVFPWLTVVSGLLILALGFVVYRRSTNEEHSHGPLGGHRHGDHPHHASHEHHAHEHAEHTHEHAEHAHEHAEHAHEHAEHAHEHHEHEQEHHTHEHVEHAEHTHEHAEHAHEHHEHEQEHHTHEHVEHAEHDHAMGKKSAPFKDLLLLGISGGVVPCHSALAILLVAVALDASWFGLLLIVAFSLGLATVLVGVGLVIVLARERLKSYQREGKILHWLPKISGALIMLIGLTITVKGLLLTGWISMPG